MSSATALMNDVYSGCSFENDLQLNPPLNIQMESGSAWVQAKAKRQNKTLIN